MFSFIKNKLKKIYDHMTSKVSALFGKAVFDDSFFEELRTILLSSDVGVSTTDEILKQLRNEIASLKTSDVNVIKELFEKLLVERLNTSQPINAMPKVILMVGVNGSGKTTFVGKLANAYKAAGKKVLLVAGDTFRAAATEQLMAWGKTIGVQVHVGKPDQDPAAVIFDASQRFINEHFDHLIIDTAGRLQTKVNLMKELEKIRRVLDKVLAGTSVDVWLSVDAMLGQNSLRQAEVFHEATQLNGCILTKFDGTGKGGIVFAIAAQYKLPVVYITFGEELEALKHFNAQEFVHDLVHG